MPRTLERRKVVTRAGEPGRRLGGLGSLKKMFGFSKTGRADAKERRRERDEKKGRFDYYLEGSDVKNGGGY